MTPVERIDLQEWMTTPGVKAVIAALTANGAVVRFVGGCVRDAVTGRAASGDIDLATPDHPEASPAQTLPPRLPEAPRGTVLTVLTDSTDSTAGDEIRLRVVPAEAAGFVLIATGDGHVFGRFALSAHPDAAQRNLDLSVLLPRSEDAEMLQVAHERPGGLRSPWRTLDWNSILETHGGISHANE